MSKILKTTFSLLVIMLLSFNQSVFATDTKEGAQKEEDPIEAMMHHLGDANEFHIAGDLSIPLPCIAWSDNGFFMTMSSSFEHGHKAVNGFVLHHGILMRVVGDDFPRDQTVDVSMVEAAAHAPAETHGPEGEQTVDVTGITNAAAPTESTEEAAHAPTIKYGTSMYTLESCMSLQNTASSWQDFSITKNVFGMLLAMILLLMVFSKVSKAYATREKQAPKGIQSFFEPLILFMRDEVVKPAIGEKDWKRFFPFIMCIFFFILFCNLLGLIPIFPGSANITGNIGVTMMLALVVFVVVNVNGTKDYWLHILWMPGVPTFVKPLLTIIEVLGIFIKPATLFIRLFANITAGHVIILSLVSLIFFFKSAMGMGGAAAGVGLAVPFVFALNLLELFVSFLQAFVFSLLTALYIGSAVEDHEDHEHGHEHATM
ncbi:MAG: ATP synthase F0 sector subunit a [uncultured Aureispira sp.]|uniref:ATP synthase subunit a n=1 Tax=uncultured Aureispira sp. TaxID=1331704 RepID=A0A6S6ULV1_9BACT|nr:MAG: ATP synthase F0 sector subunit a [uncultured Aureispira sp.]